MNDPGSSPSAVEAMHLSKTYHVHRGFGRSVAIRAVRDVSFAVARASTLGIVRESGCGKSTTAKLLLGLEQPTGDKVLYDGKTVTGTRDFRQAEASLHAGTDQGGAGRESGCPANARERDRRATESGEPAIGLRVPSAVSVRDGCLPIGQAGTGRM
jgi:ABC-type dipeptide/oligopeptide/nickel transport system ATPase component